MGYLFFWFQEETDMLNSPLWKLFEAGHIIFIPYNGKTYMMFRIPVFSKYRNQLFHQLPTRLAYRIRLLLLIEKRDVLYISVCGSVAFGFEEWWSCAKYFRGPRLSQAVEDIDWELMPQDPNNKDTWEKYLKSAS